MRSAVSGSAAARHGAFPRVEAVPVALGALVVGARSQAGRSGGGRKLEMFEERVRAAPADAKVEWEARASTASALGSRGAAPRDETRDLVRLGSGGGNKKTGFHSPSPLVRRAFGVCAAQVPCLRPYYFRPVAPARRRPTTPASQSLAPIPPPASTWRACRPMISHAADEDRRSRSQPLSPTRKTDVSKPSQSSDSTRTHLRYLPFSTNSHRLMLFRKGKRGSRGCIFHATAAIDPSSSTETKRDNLPCVQVTPKETFFLFGPTDALCPERKVPSTDDRRVI